VNVLPSDIQRQNGWLSLRSVGWNFPWLQLQLYAGVFSFLPSLAQQNLMKRFLKKVGYSLLGLLILLLAISFLLPAEQRIESTVSINAPIQLVFEQVNDLRNWESWSPWKKMDPMMEMSYSNPPSGKGAFYNWRSNDPRIGNGKQIITEVIPNEKIVTAVDFEKWEDSVSEFTFKQEKKSVDVTWSMQHRVGGNPVNKYMALFQKGTVRRMFEKGLQAIKEKTETR
jgi:uncharacterized protein YndB with AHSA1/START domain